MRIYLFQEIEEDKKRAEQEGMAVTSRKPKQDGLTITITKAHNVSEWMPLHHKPPQASVLPPWASQVALLKETASSAKLFQAWNVAPKHSYKGVKAQSAQSVVCWSTHFQSCPGTCTQAFRMSKHANKWVSEQLALDGSQVWTLLQKYRQNV